MGSFYTNITLRTTQQSALLNVLRADGRDAYVSAPRNGCIVVFDSECEDQDVDVLKSLADALSGTLRCAALAILNHDDGVLIYSLHENGALVDEYNSSPGYFDLGPGEAPEGGDAARLCRAFGVGNVTGVESVLRAESVAAGDDGYAFEHERHQALAEVLGVPVIAVNTGYNAIDQGELPDGTDARTLTRV